VPDGFRNYDAWKLMSPDDEKNEREETDRRRESLAEKSDEMRDRQKDEAAEDRRWAEIENEMLHGGS